MALGLRPMRRFVVMLGGEIAQSAFHFVLNLVLVRTMSAHDYGRFAILFLVGGLALTYVRALAGVPAGIFIPGKAGRRAARGYEVSFGSAAFALSGAIGLAVGAALWLATDMSAVAGGLFVALWAFRSYVRLALFARRDAAKPGIGDVVFAVTGSALAFMTMRDGGGDRLDATLWALAGANACGIAASLLLLRQPVRISLGRATRRRYRALMPSLTWSLVGVTTANLQGQGQSLLVAALAGPAAYAPIAAAFVLFAPLRLSASALINMVQPDMAAHLAAGRMDAARRSALACAGLLAVACAAYGAILAGAEPVIESRLWAGQFAGEPIALITVLSWAIVSVSLLHAPLRVALETGQQFHKLAGLAGVSALVGGVVVAVLLLAAAPAWSLLGVLLSEGVVLAACWRILRPWRSSRSPPRPTGRPGGQNRRPVADELPFVFPSADTAPTTRTA